jgi:hypothetical protein
MMRRSTTIEVARAYVPQVRAFAEGLGLGVEVELPQLKYPEVRLAGKPEAISQVTEKARQLHALREAA